MFRDYESIQWNYYNKRLISMRGILGALWKTQSKLELQI